MMGATEQAKYLSVQDVAKLLRVHEETVRRWIYKGQIPAVRLGKNRRAPYRIKREDVDNFLESTNGGEVLWPTS